MSDPKDDFSGANEHPSLAELRREMKKEKSSAKTVLKLLSEITDQKDLRTAADIIEQDVLHDLEKELAPDKTEEVKIVLALIELLGGKEEMARMAKTELAGIVPETHEMILIFEAVRGIKKDETAPAIRYYLDDVAKMDDETYNNPIMHFKLLMDAVEKAAHSKPGEALIKNPLRSGPGSAPKP